MEIKHLTYKEIDRLKWDKCIKQSFNGVVYAYSWYLDILSYKWEALILGDYETVMPLPVRKKYGISYIAQPKYTPQLGVFSKKIITDEILKLFVKKIPKKFKVIDLNFNIYNNIDNLKLRGRLKNKFTYELDLISEYKYITSNFSKEIKKNINKATQDGFVYSSKLTLKDILILSKQTSKNRISFENMNKLRRLMPFCINNDIGHSCGVFNSKNTLVASVFFIKTYYKTVCYFISSENSDEGNRGIIYIINQYIKENSGKNITLDFNTELNPKAKEIAIGMGGKQIKYTKLLINRLPLFISRIIHREKKLK